MVVWHHLSTHARTETGRGAARTSEESERVPERRGERLRGTLP